MTIISLGNAKPIFGMANTFSPTSNPRLQTNTASQANGLDTFTPQFSGRIKQQTMRWGAVVASAFALLCASGCIGDPPPPPSSNTCFEAIDKDCDGIYDNQDTDKDGDGVSNTSDVDVDGDGVSNWLDKYDGLNDHKFDVDHDGIIDAYDTFYGNNNGDADGDGRANGLDLQPYAAPPRGQTQTPIPSTVTKKELTDAILRQQIARQAWRDMPDGIIDSDDPNSDPMRTDRDGDHEYDYWDPEPTNGYIDSRNDPYDPRNDEYWERD